SSAEGAYLEYEIIRSTTVDQNLTMSLTSRNMTNCGSPVTTKNFLAPRTDNMATGFTATPGIQTLPSATVSILNTTIPGAWQYLWDFGDGTTSTSANVSSHTYDTYGDYTITLTVSNNDCIETVSQNVRINPIPPVLDFDYLPASGCAPHTVTFIN